MDKEIPSTVEECELDRYIPATRQESMISAMMRLSKRMIEIDREDLIIGMYFQEQEVTHSDLIIGRFTASEATGRRGEWADYILNKMMKRSIFDYSNIELAKIIREGPLKTDPLKHLDYEGKLLKKAIAEGQRRQVLAYLEVN